LKIHYQQQYINPHYHAKNMSQNEPSLSSPDSQRLYSPSNQTGVEIMHSIFGRYLMPDELVSNITVVRTHWRSILWGKPELNKALPAILGVSLSLPHRKRGMDRYFGGQCKEGA
jgi:hypothetical protein